MKLVLGRWVVAFPFILLSKRSCIHHICFIYYLCNPQHTHDTYNQEAWFILRVSDNDYDVRSINKTLLCGIAAAGSDVDLIIHNQSIRQGRGFYYYIPTSAAAHYERFSRSSTNATKGCQRLRVVGRFGIPQSIGRVVSEISRHDTLHDRSRGVQSSSGRYQTRLSLLSQAGMSQLFLYHSRFSVSSRRQRFVGKSSRSLLEWVLAWKRTCRTYQCHGSSGIAARSCSL